MNELIKLPINASGEQFAQYVGEDEYRSSPTESRSGRKIVTGHPGLDIIGKRLVGFHPVYEGGPITAGRTKPRAGSGTFVGWRKVQHNYVVESRGEAFRDNYNNGELTCYFYLRSV